MTRTYDWWDEMEDSYDAFELPGEYDHLDESPDPERPVIDLDGPTEEELILRKYGYADEEIDTE